MAIYCNNPRGGESDDGGVMYELLRPIADAKLLNSDKIDAEVKKIVAQRVEIQEHFIARFLHETGLKIEDCELVEETDVQSRNPSVRWYIRKRQK